MQHAEQEASALQPEESWGALSTAPWTGRARPCISPAWNRSCCFGGAIVALGLLGQYAIATLAPEFASGRPWFPAPLWGAC